VGALCGRERKEVTRGRHALRGVVLLSVPRRVVVVYVQQHFHVLTKALPSSPHPQRSETRKRAALCGTQRAESRACRSIAHTCCCGCQLAPTGHRARVRACAALTRSLDHISGCSSCLPAILSPPPTHSVSWPFTIHELIAAVAVSQFSGHTERRRASSGALAITGSLRFGL
jgi:hypothetical protein